MIASRAVGMRALEAISFEQPVWIVDVALLRADCVHGGLVQMSV